MTPPGDLVLELLASPHSLDELVAHVLALAPDADPAVVRRDLTELLTSWCELGITWATN